MLLVGAVALSAALIVTVACALATAHAAIETQVGSTVGYADLKIQPAGSGAIPASVLEEARAWPEVASAAGRFTAALALETPRRMYRQRVDGAITEEVASFTALALATGLDPSAPDGRSPLVVIEGRLPAGPGEIAVDERTQHRLTWEWQAEVRRAPVFQITARGTATEAEVREAIAANKRQSWIGVGDQILIRRLLRPTETFTIVGIIEPPPMGDRAMAWMTIAELQRLHNARERFTEIDLILTPGTNAEDVIAARAPTLGDGFLLQTTAKITAGLDRNMKSSELGFILALVLSTLAAGFIILTGLNTSVAERQWELAIVRCIGGTRGQVARSQLLIGLLLGVGGAGVGVPLGLALSWVLAMVLREELKSELAISPSGVVLSGVGAVCAGLIGAVWPAWRASRVSPMNAMRSRASPAKPRGFAIMLAAGLAGLLVQAIIVGGPSDGQIVFWGYATVGLPLMFVGYFLLSVPMTLLVAWAAGPALSRVLGLPRNLLARTVRATPYSHGLTAGALMGGLALMISIWTNGGAILRDWLDKIDFPDAFVSGLALSEDSQRTLDAMPFVENTCAITLHPVETDTFGVRALQTYRSTFIAFEPERFFAITTLTWVQGSEAVARARLEQGGAILVAREFLIAQGLGMGDSIRLSSNDRTHEFEIVGVVTSPGLDIVSRFFNIGEEYHQQAIHAVFGTRGDLKEKFGVDAIHLIQIDLADDVDDAQAIETIRGALFEAGILDVGTGRRIKEEIRTFATSSLLVFSVVAIVQMFVACFGVANIIIASIDARQFEFGVLRAIGAPRGLLSRLVLGEALIIAITASIIGTMMGMQGSWAGQRLYALLLGLVLELRPPWGAIAVGWGIMAATSLGAALPAVVRLAKRRPRDLLASMKG